MIGVSTSMSDGGVTQPPSGDGQPQPSDEAARRAERRRLIGGSRPGEVVREVATEHQPPPPAPPAQVVEIPYGVRVPTFVVSPWVSAGPAEALATDGRHTFDFCSILKTVLVRFTPDDRPFLSDRVEASNSLEALLTEPRHGTSRKSPPRSRSFPLRCAGSPPMPAQSRPRL